MKKLITMTIMAVIWIASFGQQDTIHPANIGVTTRAQFKQVLGINDKANITDVADTYITKADSSSTEGKKYVTGKMLVDGLATKQETGSYLTSVGTGTTNQLTYWSGTNSLGALSTTIYPSLTELSYVKGVTSGIQSQINAKGVGDMLLGATQEVTETKTFLKDKLLIKGTSTGTTNITTANTSSSSYTATLPATTGTLYISNGTDVSVVDGGTGRSTGTTAYSLIATGTTATGAQQTLANGATTQILVGGGASALPTWTTATGTGAPVRTTSPTLITPTIASIVNTGTLTLPTTTGTIALTSDITSTAYTKTEIDASKSVAVLNAKTDNYTLILSDAGKTIVVTAATAKTITIPLNTTVAYPVGTFINISSLGDGAVTVAVTATGTLLSNNNLVTIRNKSIATILKTDINTWQLFGGLE